MEWVPNAGGKTAAKHHTARFIRAPDQEVIMVIPEMKRLARNTAELLLATLQRRGIRLKLLTGPLAGIHDPNGMGAMLAEALSG